MRTPFNGTLIEQTKKSGEKEDFRGWVALSLAFLLLALSVVASGIIYYRQYATAYRFHVESQLTAIADLKVADLTQYRKERMGDVSMFFQNAPFSALVRRFLDNPEDADAQSQLQIWFGKYQPFYDQVFLLDGQGVIRLSSPAGLPAASSFVAKGVSDVLGSGQPAFQDFYRSEQDQRIYLGIMAPIFDEQNAHRPLGVFYMRIDPETYLYPFIKRWPTASQTAETLLVRREGNEVVFLNELRFQTNSALNLRMPLDRAALPAAKAALGREGFMEGTDYRGVRVLAAMRAIPNSPWMLVARMDAAEAYALMRTELWQVVFMAGVLLLGAGAFAGALWRQQRVRFYREKAETTEALRASEVRYRRLFESAKDGILILDAETGMILDVNPFLIEFLKYPREAFLGKRVWELGSFKDIIANRDNFLILQQKEYIRYEDLPLETSDGGQVEVEFVSNVYQVNNHKVIQCNIRDITERIQTIKTLRESQRLIEGIINAIPVRVFWKDKNLAYLGCNMAFARDAGFADPKDLIGKDDFQMVWRAQADLYRSDDLQVIMSDCPKLLSEEPQTTSMGNTITLLTSKVPLHNSEGKVCGVIGSYMDITERKRGEDVRNRLAMAVEQANDTIVITDTDANILYTNPAFEKSTGYTRAEALGQNPHILKSGKQDAEFYRQMWGVLNGGEVWHGHFINRRKSGELYEEEATISPVRDAAGNTINYVAVKRDVTREVRIESQFRHLQKMEAFGQLASGVAHDFNNILAVISGSAQLLLMDEKFLSAEGMEYVKQVINAAERAATLTRQLLIFGRKQEMQSKPVALNDVIENLAKMLERVIREDIALECQYAARLPFIQGDPGMLEQVLLNLVVNARDAMPNGGQLVIATEGTSVTEACARRNPEARPGEFVCLTVSDTGAGITSEHMQRIFEPFFTTKEVGKGTGLGLATVYSIVKQHQGWIEVSSRLGEGSTFKIFLPVVPAPVEKIAAAEAKPNQSDGNELILLVEDEEPVRMVTRRMLERHGYTVLLACAASEAREAWRSYKDKVALLLTDIIMPEGVTGCDLAAELRKDRPGLKVVFMSGYSAEALGKDTELFRRPGTSFIYKPWTADHLIRTVRECLDAR